MQPTSPRKPFIDDLVPLVLQADDHWWPSDLVRLSTLSSTWLWHARKRLYQHPSVHSFSAAVLLANSLATNSALTYLVGGICLSPMAEHFHPRSTSELRAIRFLLGLEGLRRVTLGGELAVKAERFLRLISIPDDLTELHIDGSQLHERLSSPPSLEWDESLHFGIPNLTKLRLTHIELDIGPPSMFMPSSITELCLEQVDITSGYLTHLLNGRDTLDRLHICTDDPAAYDEQLCLVLASCAVTCLHYETKKDYKSSDVLFGATIENMEKLRCLHLEGHFVDSAVLHAVDTMCKNLVELGIFGRGVRVSASEWRELIKSGAFVSLRRLGLPWGTNQPPFLGWGCSDIQQLEEACACRKIDTQ